MRDYLDQTRSAWGSYLFVLPLLFAYQIVALVGNLGQPRHVINGADAILQVALRGMGLNGWLGSWLVVALLVGLVLRWRWSPKKPVALGYFSFVLLESTAYALVFGSLVSMLTSLVLPMAPFLQMGGGGLGFGQKLAASLGAGLYEELVFRVILTGGAIGLLKASGVKRGAAVAVAVIFSSVIFSAFHYIGPSGDLFSIGSFTFRAIAGLVLAGLFAARGFAVAAWTHALYDVFLLLVGRA